MMKPQPLIALADVVEGSRWFQRVLGLSSGHGGNEYEMLMDGDTMVAQLHAWSADEHASMGRSSEPSRGNGVLLWFATDDFDGLMQRVIEADASVVDGPLDNPKSQRREVWLRGPEGYMVVVSGPKG